MKPHYYIHQPVIDRFWHFVDKRKESDCWLWTGTLFPNGYGSFTHQGRKVGAHRFMFRIIHGPPGNMYVCHVCDNKPCVNPIHLFLGSSQDNTLDAINKGRRAVQGVNNCKNKLTEENVHEIRRRIFIGETHKEIAKIFNVTPSAIGNISTRANWDWLKTVQLPYDQRAEECLSKEFPAC